MKSLLLQQMGLAALLAGVTTMLVTPLVKKLARQAGVVRYPRERDAHTEPTPLWGGVAMVVGFFVAFLVIRLVLGGALPQVHGAGHGPRPFFGVPPHPILGTLVGAALVAFIGLLDDRIDLSPKLQILGLLLGGFVAAALGARIDGMTNPLTGGYLQLPMWLSVLGTMAWAFLATKTFDFLDGLDGLAAGTCAIAAMTMGLMAALQREVTVALLAAALVGACLGFLRHNYNPASIFMGTVGSYFLGFLLAMLAVTGAFKIPAAISVVVPIFVMGVPIFDALYVVGRRVVEKRAPTAADKTHIHHRLTQSGLSVRKAVWAIYGLTAGTCVLALIIAWTWGR
jgi:UDP-GlcNAc:undecaprenyl-phosphate/decaprenyl-phosphate GlcNAc-1-phosphate transferase